MYVPKALFAPYSLPLWLHRRNGSKGTTFGTISSAWKDHRCVCISSPSARLSTYTYMCMYIILLLYRLVHRRDCFFSCYVCLLAGLKLPCASEPMNPSPSGAWKPLARAFTTLRTERTMRFLGSDTHPRAVDGSAPRLLRRTRDPYVNRRFRCEIFRYRRCVGVLDRCRVGYFWERL